MDINIKGANEHNLKNVSVSIPMYQITGITGVSGSGKSTLLRDILASKGAINYTLIHTKTVRDALRISDYVNADSIENLPQTIFIDVKSSVKNSSSTVSTISGIHELLKNIFTEFGNSSCALCGNETFCELTNSTILKADILYDEKYKEISQYIEKRGKLIKESFFDKFGKPAKKSISYITIEFTLDKPSDNSIRRFNKEFFTSIYISNNNESYNPLTTQVCPNCNQIIPRLSRSRLSFNTSYSDGGGACRCCNGSGEIQSIEQDKLVLDINKSLLEGAVHFVTNKGIKHTTVTEVFLKAVANHYGFDITLPLKSLSDENLKIIFYGGNDEISFKDRVGGNKLLKYDGVINYLINSYKSGKGKSALAPFITNSVCPECNGERFDKLIKGFSVHSANIGKILSMTISEFGKWCRSIKENDTTGKEYFESLISKCEHYEAVSCGHLSLDRRSNTLSGGELQRLRLCSLLNSDIDNICYLLDEPSSGLHYSDIEKLGTLFKRICSCGNTMIIVEHNCKLLEYCDNIVDMGPTGGEHGGNVLFSDNILNISKYSTPTVECLLNPVTASLIEGSPSALSTDINNCMEFGNLTYNNLKNVTVHLPYNKFTSVCGVSGSGKTTFVKYVVYQSVSPDPTKYGFDEVYFVSQDNLRVSSLSTIATQSKIMEHIAKLYSKSSKISKSSFMLRSKEGKCTKCEGKGIILSADNENLGICDACNGKRYNQEVLSVKINGCNISQLIDMPISELGRCIEDSKIKRLSEVFSKFDIGYLTLSRPISTLSKGEAQRLRLANSLFEKRVNTLFLLDEPAKGLHPQNIETLLSAIQELLALNNTVVAVEHEPFMIKKSDYIIEFGGTGIEGGYLLYEGTPISISKDTPTGKMLFHTFSLPKETIIKPTLTNITISNIDSNISIPRFSCVRDLEEKELVESAMNISNDKFLSVAIPNNIFFSKLNNEDIKVVAPISILIDFKQSIRYDISIYAALNIKQLVLRKLQSIYPESFEMLKYLFTETSVTGKCKKCCGTGKVFEVPREYFLTDGELSKSCVKFLNNSTQYKEIKKILKTKCKVDISKKYSEMSDFERNILFSGTTGLLEVEDDSIEWKGIIEQFLLYHKYYPENDSDTVFKKKKEVTCPICNGKRIQEDYYKFTIWGLNFGDILSIPISNLLSIICKKKYLFEIDYTFLEPLKHIVSLGLGEYTLADSLLSINAQAAQLINFVSKFTNNIYGASIMMKNFSTLSTEQRAYVNSLVEKWKDNNTIIIFA